VHQAAVDETISDTPGRGNAPTPPISPSIEKHHVFPQKFDAEWIKMFEGAGESYHDYTIPIRQGIRQALTESWESEVEEFMYAAETLPSLADSKSFVSELISKYKLTKYLPVVPYK
jgi:hypothetical protein